MLVTINVTQQDIDNGKTCVSSDCPVAWALNRVLKTGHWSQIGNPSFTIWTNNEVVHQAYLPSPVGDFIRRFDSFLDIDPFTFQLELPERMLNVTS